MRFLTLFALLLVSQFANAGKISGVISDTNRLPLAFSSIIVKSTAQGTSANINGEYVLELPPGQYIISCQHVGYKSLEKKVVVENADQQLNFTLEQQQYNLAGVTVKNGEDPAYAIMRNAIQKRSFYENENKKFQADVYIKGQFKMRDYPSRFFGQKVDFGDGDTSKRKIVFLSETVARYSVAEPDRKIEVLSTKVSGDKDGFGFSNPQVISFYSNNIQIAALNPRGFVSPIATNALNFYNYHFEGTFFENDLMVSRIRVLPKRKYEPLFNGYINIIENSWRIHSLQLVLLRENQVQLADTLLIEQVYVPFANTWVIKQQNIYPSIMVFGFDVSGSFVQVYDKFNLAPQFPKQFFNNTVLKVYDSANTKSSIYWDSIRPVPLLTEEVRDYVKKDSLEEARKDPAYLDSLDRARNKPNIMALIITGQTFSNRNKKSSVKWDALLDVVSFNTVEGAVINLSPTYTKRLSDKGRESIRITPNFRYGFSSERFNAHLSTTYTFNSKNAAALTVAGGRAIFQVDNASPVLARTNTFSTLIWENNLFKLYEAGFAQIRFRKAVGNGLNVSAGFQFQDRRGLRNTTLHKWRDVEDREFTPNLYITNHQASLATVEVSWQPGAKYIEVPASRINIGSGFPTFTLGLTRGIKGLFESDVDFTKWKFNINDDINLKLAGRFQYRLGAGGFLSRKSVYLPDYNHYIGNQTNTAAVYLNSFQLMPYYSYSNVEKFYAVAHTEYHLNGLLTNKIPFVKKLNWFLVAGNNTLYLNSNTMYTEVFVGLENILKVLRIDFVKSFTKNGVQPTSGIRFSIPVFTQGNDN